MFRTAIPLASAAVIALSAFQVMADDAKAPLAAKIDGDIEITVAEVDTMMANFVQSQQARGMPSGTDFSEMRSQALDYLVQQKLLLREADKNNVTISDAEIDEYAKQRLPPGMTLAQIAERQGMTEAAIRDELRLNLRIPKLIETKFTDIAAPTDAELQAAFDEIKQRQPDFATLPAQVEARHILIKAEKDTSAEDKAAAREKLAEIRTRIVEGKEDFAKLAAEFSDCPSGERDGGNLGMFTRGRMVKPFEDAAFAQDLNVVGEIVETDFGFHIIEVLKRTEAVERTLESERERLSDYVSNQKKSEIAGKFIESLKENAKIEIIEVPTPPAAEAPGERELPAWAR